MQIVSDEWQSVEPGVEEAPHVNRANSPEGIDVVKVRMAPGSSYNLLVNEPHIISVVRGPVYYMVRDDLGNDRDGIMKRFGMESLKLESRVNLYLPAGIGGMIEVPVNIDHRTAEVLKMSAPKDQTGGDIPIVRDEKFVVACVSKGQPLRYVLTAQCVSRRVFLHHDKTILSKRGKPMSLFNTTMFDTKGLPLNDEGDPVFRMSYNSRTEFNTAYDVTANARVRFAQHPYSFHGKCGDGEQRWSDWYQLGSNRTYSLTEPAGGAEEENVEIDGEMRSFRNKHQVYIADGYVSHYCGFDPAPVGIEQHQPGTYTDYEPYEMVTKRQEYRAFAADINRFDDMVNLLSLARARGELDGKKTSYQYKLYESGLVDARLLANELIASLSQDRQDIVRPWIAELE